MEQGSSNSSLILHTSIEECSFIDKLERVAFLPGQVLFSSAYLLQLFLDGWHETRRNSWHVSPDSTQQVIQLISESAHQLVLLLGLVDQSFAHLLVILLGFKLAVAFPKLRDVELGMFEGVEIGLANLLNKFLSILSGQLLIGFSLEDQEF